MPGEANFSPAQFGERVGDTDPRRGTAISRYPTCLHAASLDGERAAEGEFDAAGAFRHRMKTNLGRDPPPATHPVAPGRE